jgi:hypothetical protein
MYGCGIWSLTLREEHILRVFENRVLSRIFKSKRDEVTGVRFEVSTAVNMMIIIFWEMTPCGSYMSHTVSFPRR